VSCWSALKEYSARECCLTMSSKRMLCVGVLQIFARVLSKNIPRGRAQAQGECSSRKVFPTISAGMLQRHADTCCRAVETLLDAYRKHMLKTSVARSYCRLMLHTDICCKHLQTQSNTCCRHICSLAGWEAAFGFMISILFCPSLLGLWTLDQSKTI
jgi:hypothetical protein